MSTWSDQAICAFDLETTSPDPTRARIVLFRRPLELRAQRPRELILLLHDIMVEQVATYLGVDPETIDPTLRG